MKYIPQYLRNLMSMFDQPHEDMEKLAQILKAVWEAKM